VSAKSPALLMFLALVAATCRNLGPIAVGPGPDGGYGGAPGRNVVTPSDGYLGALADGPTSPVGSRPIGGGGGGSGGGSGGADGGARADGRLPDRPADRPSTVGCSLLRQDCPLGRGCYPAGAGTTACQPEGTLAENTQCLEHEMCAPGNLCVDVHGGGDSSLCEPICDPLAANPCPGGRTCQSYSGTTAGYCRP
jgi:hypothetical protein